MDVANLDFGSQSKKIPSDSWCFFHRLAAKRHAKHAREKRKEVVTAQEDQEGRTSVWKKVRLDYLFINRDLMISPITYREEQLSHSSP